MATGPELVDAAVRDGRICPNPVCGANLNEPGSITYLSGDTKDCHFEVQESYTEDSSVLALVFDADGECDSRIECAACGVDVSVVPHENKVWD